MLRISSITDPQGNKIYYSYDRLNDLQGFTDQTGNWAAVVGYSPSGESYFQLGSKSNSFASLVGYSGQYRSVSGDANMAISWLIDKVQAFISNVVGSGFNPDSLPNYTDILNEN